MALSKVVQLIETRSTIGKGNEQDPLRQIIEYFNFDGVRVAIQDPATWYKSEPPLPARAVSPGE